MQHSIFIGYRRNDTADVSGRVYDRLRSEFGHAGVFKDVDNLPVGTDFGDYILTVLPKCRVFLAMIGPGWTDARDESGGRRLDDPADWVRIELETALTTPGLQVVPVLVNGALMPRANELPPGMQGLPRLNAAFVRRDPDFHKDMDKLVDEIRRSEAAVDRVALDVSSVAPASPPTGTLFDQNRFVFISYPKTVDANVMRSVVRAIIANGIPVWLYDPVPFGFEPHELIAMHWQRAGLHNEAETVSAIQHASCTVALIGRSTAGSDFQERELARAVKTGRIATMIIDDLPVSELPKSVRGRHSPRLTSEQLGRGTDQKILAMLASDVGDYVNGSKAAFSSSEHGRKGSSAPALLWATGTAAALIAALGVYLIDPLGWFGQGRVATVATSTVQPAQIQALGPNVDEASRLAAGGRAAYNRKDYARAFEDSASACAGGNSTGCNILGLLYDNGQGVARDDARAAELYRKACDDGHNVACYNLAVQYDNGEGVAPDDARARELYSNTCNSGYAPACSNLGVMYETGEGVTRDAATAADFYKRGCALGSNKSCAYLGELLENGDGLVRELSLARELYKQACDGGETLGCDALTRLDAVGK